MLHLVTAIVKPHMLDAVKDALREAGIAGLTVTEVKGFGRQGGHTETYRGAEYKIDFVPKVKIEVLCDSGEAEKIAEVIAGSARTGKIGDGKIWIAAIDRAVRIRTGEMGLDAVRSGAGVAERLMARRATAREPEGDGVRGRSPRDRRSRSIHGGRSWALSNPPPPRPHPARHRAGTDRCRRRRAGRCAPGRPRGRPGRSRRAIRCRSVARAPWPRRAPPRRR